MAFNEEELAAEISNTRLAVQEPEEPESPQPRTQAALLEQEVSEWEEEPLTGSTEASIKNHPLRAPKALVWLIDPQKSFSSFDISNMLDC